MSSLCVLPGRAIGGNLLSPQHCLSALTHPSTSCLTCRSSATLLCACRDENDNLLITQYGLSTYIDHQTVTIQELPETAPPGQLPRSGACAQRAGQGPLACTAAAACVRAAARPAAAPAALPHSH